MKTLLSSLLLGAMLSLLAPATAAQRVHASAYSGHQTGYKNSGHMSRSYESSRVWVPGGYEIVDERVWVPGRTERVWIDPSFGFRIGSCGERFQVQVSTGYWRTVQHPGHYEIRRVRVYVPGHWAKRGRGC
jgi:hypothetical protein